MKNIARRVVEYYSEYDEDGRLQRHPVEFAVTLRILQDHIGKTGRLLDAGTGTGRYAIAFAELGYSVWAEDISSKNVGILRAKLADMERSLTINVRVNDVCDLSSYPDDFFDTILLMGPVYHLPRDEALVAIREAMRVLNLHSGVIAISFVNKYPGYENDRYAEVIRFYGKEDIELLLSDVGLVCRFIAPTDGLPYKNLSKLLQRACRDEKRISAWLDGHKSLLLGELGIDGCIHGLAVARKRAA